MDTISVPYMPKMSPFFPKFVDPKAMISKKTDMLSNLFGGLGPVAYNAADVKPIGPYGASSDDTSGASLFNEKRDAVPQDGKEKATDGGMYRRGMFGPFAPKFGPMGPKFGPFPPFASSAETMTPDYAAGQEFVSRRRRQSVAAPADNVNSISSAKSEIADGGDPATAKAAGGVPKEYLPGAFGPFGPTGPFGPFGPPMVDPSAFTAKKSAFLDTLFKNIAATTTTSTTTEAPTPKSTIVPASFWMPSSMIPGPTEYTSKVSDFLDKLFDSLKLNATTAADGSADGSADDLAKSDFMRSLKATDDDAAAATPERIVARAATEDLSSIAAAKDAIADAILSELGDLKGDMMTTLSDLIAYEKATAAATAKKPSFKPFAGLWPAKPTMPDATLPFQQRMAALSQVFDMLTELQRNITVAAKSAMTTAGTPAPENAESSSPTTTTAAPGPDVASSQAANATLLNAILSKMLNSAAATPPPATAYPMPTGEARASPAITSRALAPKGPMSFWVSYPEAQAAAVKRQANGDSVPYPDYGDNDDNDDRHDDRRQYTRGVKMQMHQGYQSLPAGSVESVQAGGGSTPGHQGGGIKLLVSVRLLSVLSVRLMITLMINLKFQMPRMCVESGVGSQFFTESENC